MPRGGRRNGRASSTYGNRTDLHTPKPLAPTAVPGQQYGEAGAQLAAQAAVPMAPSPASVGTPTPPAPPGPVPGALDMHRPTDRPGEHVLSGVPTGPGPGIEAMNFPQPGPDPMVDALAVLANARDRTPQMDALRARLQATVLQRSAP